MRRKVAEAAVSRALQEVTAIERLPGGADDELSDLITDHGFGAVLHGVLAMLDGYLENAEEEYAGEPTPDYKQKVATYKKARAAVAKAYSVIAKLGV